MPYVAYWNTPTDSTQWQAITMAASWDRSDPPSKESYRLPYAPSVSKRNKDIFSDNKICDEFVRRSVLTSARRKYLLITAVLESSVGQFCWEVRRAI
jgi:hypothetical protein